jgi:hypothetical protein
VNDKWTDRLGVTLAVVIVVATYVAIIAASYVAIAAMFYITGGRPIVRIARNVGSAGFGAERRIGLRLMPNSARRCCSRGALEKRLMRTRTPSCLAPDAFDVFSSLVNMGQRCSRATARRTRVPVDPAIRTPHLCQRIVECGLLTET